jgi:predicted nucleotidyltransferase
MTASLVEVYRLALQLEPEERRQLLDYLAHPPRPLPLDEIITTLQRHQTELRAHNVENIGVFGSHARGEAEPASDIDLLVTLNQPSLTGYVRLKLYLEELLGRPVDLVQTETIRPELKDQIMREVVYVQGL